jgi:hypothetical protein
MWKFQTTSILNTISMLFLSLKNDAVSTTVCHETDTGYLKYKMGREEKEPKCV